MNGCPSIIDIVSTSSRDKSGYGVGITTSGSSAKLIAEALEVRQLLAEVDRPVHHRGELANEDRRTELSHLRVLGLE